MALISMSGRELQRIEVLSEVLAKRRPEISAAAILGLSTRQTRRRRPGSSRWVAFLGLRSFEPADCKLDLMCLPFILARQKILPPVALQELRQRPGGVRIDI
jgi:hypothetical protein